MAMAVHADTVENNLKKGVKGLSQLPCIAFICMYLFFKFNIYLFFIIFPMCIRKKTQIFGLLKEKKLGLQNEKKKKRSAFHIVFFS